MNDSFRDMIAEGWLVIYMDNLLVFSPDEETHCERTKHVLQHMTELDLPDLAAPFAIATDASKYAFGAILLQTDPNGEWHPCSYLSQSFSPAAQNYNIYDRELLAIVVGGPGPEPPPGGGGGPGRVVGAS